MSIRRNYLDRLRLFAAFLVIILNVQGSTSALHATINQLSSIAVPLFLLVTGSLIFKKPYTRQKQISRILLMLATYFVFGVVEYICAGGYELIPYMLYPFTYKRWIGIGVSVFFAYYYIIAKKPLSMILCLLSIYLFFSVVDFALCEDKGIVNAIFDAKSYRWYLLMLAGIYLIQPILYRIANEKKLLHLGIIAGLIYALCYNLSLIGSFSFFNIFTQGMAAALAYRAIFYLLLGRFMVDFMISHDSFRLKRVKIYAFVLIIISTIIQTNLVKDNGNLGYSDYFSIFIIANSLLVYTLVYSYTFSSEVHKICGNAALYIYLYHWPVMKLLDKIFLFSTKANTPLNIMLYSAIIFVLSALLAVITKYVIKLIQPYLGKKTDVTSEESV